MMDLIWRANNKQTLLTLAVKLKLGTIEDGEFREAVGFMYTPWPDPPIPGAIALINISHRFSVNGVYDKRTPGENDTDRFEQWGRSRIARWIKNNSTSGTIAGGAISYREVDGVRMYRPGDVTAWLASQGLQDMHSWQQGNSF